MAKQTNAGTKTAATDADLAEIERRIGRLAIEANQAHTKWTNGRHFGRGALGADGQRDLTAKKGRADLELREAIKQYLGD